MLDPRNPRVIPDPDERLALRVRGLERGQNVSRYLGADKHVEMVAGGQSEYRVGHFLDTADMVVSARYDDGARESVDCGYRVLDETEVVVTFPAPTAARPLRICLIG